MHLPTGTQHEPISHPSGRPGRPPVYPLDAMDVDDWCLLPISATRAAQNAVRRHCRRHDGQHFVVRPPEAALALLVRVL